MTYPLVTEDSCTLAAVATAMQPIFVAEHRKAEGLSQTFPTTVTTLGLNKKQSSHQDKFEQTKTRTGLGRDQRKKEQVIQCNRDKEAAEKN
jgi:hypothetical protein